MVLADATPGHRPGQGARPGGSRSSTAGSLPLSLSCLVPPRWEVPSAAGPEAPSASPLGPCGRPGWHAPGRCDVSRRRPKAVDVAGLHCSGAGTRIRLRPRRGATREDAGSSRGESPLGKASLPWRRGRPTRRHVVQLAPKHLGRPTRPEAKGSGPLRGRGEPSPFGRNEPGRSGDKGWMRVPALDPPEPPPRAGTAGSPVGEGKKDRPGLPIEHPKPYTRQPLLRLPCPTSGERSSR
jgi:hypothetical protein